MELIIDANIVISAVISSSGKTRDLLFSDKFRLYAPDKLLTEFETHKQEILTKSKLSEADLDLALTVISTRIRFIPILEFQKFIQKAKEVSPDPNDAEYFALALKHNCPIWSNDKLLKNQKDVNVINTTELLSLSK